MSNISKLVLCLFFLFLTACSGGSSGGGPGITPDGNDPLGCSDVVTEDMVSNFNKGQSDFSIKTGGSTVECKVTTTVNGKTEEVEANGYSMVRILPGLKYIETKTDNNDYQLYFEKVIPTEEDAKAILAKLGLPFVTGAAPSFAIDYNSYPSYLRFGKGALFYVDGERSIEQDEKELLVFGIEADSDQEQYVDSKMQSFLNGTLPLEVIWYPRNGDMATQTAKKNQSSIVWSQLSAEDVLVSMVRDNEEASRQVVVRAIDHISYWNLDVKIIHSQLPELYNFALGQWRNPAIADNTSSELLTQLRYVVKVDANSPLKVTLDTYELINKYQQTTAISLRTAVDYIAGKLWNKNQFDLLLEVSEVLYESFSSNSWDLSQAILDRINYQQAPALLAARIGMQLKKHRMLGNSSTTYVIDEVFEKIHRGMTNSNIDLYFGTFDYFKSNLRASSSDAESACDDLVLSGQINSTNQTFYLSFLDWLKNTAYVKFAKAYQILLTMTDQQNLSVSQVNLFKQTYEWLKGTAYMNRDNSLTKASEYLGRSTYTLSVFSKLKSYYEWLKNTIYLNRDESLKRAEEAVVMGGLQPNEIDAIKSLANWYISEIYMNKKEALNRSESLVLVKKISPAQLTVMKDVVSWLVSDIYLNRKVAATKGEEYVLGNKALTAQSATLLKSYTNWLISDMYLNRNVSLEKAESFVLAQGFNSSQISTLKKAATWLNSDVYLNRNDSLAKSEKYLAVANITPRKFELLKQEYEAQRQANKQRPEALKIAEGKVLNL